jgi:hypothetical protein
MISIRIEKYRREWFVTIIYANGGEARFARDTLMSALEQVAEVVEITETKGEG